MSDSTPEASAPEINAGLYETVVEAQKARDEARKANDASYETARERLDEVAREIRERREQLGREDRAHRVARTSVDRAYSVRNAQIDREYKVAVFGDEADTVDNYAAGLDY